MDKNSIISCARGKCVELLSSGEITIPLQVGDLLAKSRSEILCHSIISNKHLNADIDDDEEEEGRRRRRRRISYSRTF